MFHPRNAKVLLLTFDTKRVPEEVTAASLRYPVRVVVPFPRRCTRCQKYGHKAGSCWAPHEICAMCGATWRPPERHPDPDLWR